MFDEIEKEPPHGFQRDVNSYDNKVYMFYCDCFHRSRSLRNPANYLVLNLAICDFLILGTNLPALIYNSVQQGPALGSIGCQVYGFLGGLCGTTSIMTLTGIAIDRYYVIVFPLTPFKRASNKRSILLMIAAIWIYALTFSSLPLFGVNAYVPEGTLTSCSFDYLSKDIKSRIFIFVFFLAAWVLPLFIITFSYVKIYRTVSKADNSEFFHEANAAITARSLEMPRCFRIGRSMNKARTETKIAKTAFIAVSVWVVTWTPFAILSLIGIVFGPNYHLITITPIGSLIPCIICKCGSIVNPFVYALSHPKFQRELNSAIMRSGCVSFCNENVHYPNPNTLDSISFSPASLLILKKTSARRNKKKARKFSSEKDLEGKSAENPTMKSLTTPKTSTMVAISVQNDQYGKNCVKCIATKEITFTK